MEMCAVILTHCRVVHIVHSTIIEENENKNDCGWNFKEDNL